MSSDRLVNYSLVQGIYFGLDILISKVWMTWVALKAFFFLISVAFVNS